MPASRRGETMRAFCVQMGQKSAVWSFREAGQAIEIMVGVAGFEPATPASRTQCVFSKSLIFIAMAAAIPTFCSRSFHPIHCDFIAMF
jgi:hypothetical protein